jgi:hypothetical protein
MAKGGHGLPKVSAMPYPFMTRRRATAEAAIRPFQGWPVRSKGGLQPYSAPSYAPRRTPMQLLRVSRWGEQTIRKILDRRSSKLGTRGSRAAGLCVCDLTTKSVGVRNCQELFVSLFTMLEITITN